MPFIVSDKELDIRNDDGKVEPVPAVAQVRELVQDEPARQNLYGELITVD